MTGFVYFDKPAQLAYYARPEGVYQLLPFWVVDANDLQRLERCIRAKAFGSINLGDFVLYIYTNATYCTPDGETLFRAPIFNESTGFPATAPSSGVLNKNFLT